MKAHCIIKEKGIKGDIPAIVIGNSVINYDDYNGDEEKLRKLIDEALVSQEAIKIDSQGNNDRRYSQSYTNLYGREPDLGNLSLSSIVAVLLFWLSSWIQSLSAGNTDLSSSFSII
jgi:hypothetical protein